MVYAIVLHLCCSTVAYFHKQHFDTQTIFKYLNDGVKLPQNTQKHLANFVFPALYFIG